MLAMSDAEKTARTEFAPIGACLPAVLDELKVPDAGAISVRCNPSADMSPSAPLKINSLLDLQHSARLNLFMTRCERAVANIRAMWFTFFCSPVMVAASIYRFVSNQKKK